MDSLIQRVQNNQSFFRRLEFFQNKGTIHDIVFITGLMNERLKQICMEFDITVFLADKLTHFPHYLIRFHSLDERAWEMLLKSQSRRRKTRSEIQNRSRYKLRVFNADFVDYPFGYLKGFWELSY